MGLTSSRSSRLPPALLQPCDLRLQARALVSQLLVFVEQLNDALRLAGIRRLQRLNGGHLAGDNPALDVLAIGAEHPQRDQAAGNQHDECADLDQQGLQFRIYSHVPPLSREAASPPDPVTGPATPAAELRRVLAARPARKERKPQRTPPTTAPCRRHCWAHSGSGETSAECSRWRTALPGCSVSEIPGCKVS